MFEDTNNSLFVQQKAQLILIMPKPNRVANHYKRPYEMDVNNHHLDTIQTVIAEGQGTGITAGTIMRDNKMLDMIRPTSDAGFSVPTSRLNDRYLCILKLPTGDSDRRAMRTSVQNQIIHMGYCTEEPISAQQLHAAVIGPHSLNPACDLIITKYINLVGTSRLDPTGGRTARFECLNDVSVISSDDSLRLFDDASQAGGSFGGATPDSVYGLDSLNIDAVATESKAVRGDYGAMTIHDDSRSLHRSRTIPVDSRENSTMFKATHFMERIRTAADQNEHNIETLMTADNLVRGDIDSIKNNLKACVAHETNNELQGKIREGINSSIHGQVSRGMSASYTDTTRISLGDLARNYGHGLEVLVIYEDQTDSPRRGEFDGFAAPVDFIDQNYHSETTVYSSMVAATIPAFMANLGIDALSFRYDTRNENDFTLGMSRFAESGKSGAVEAFNWQHFSTITKVGDQGKMHLLKQFQQMVRHDLMPILAEAARPGDRTSGEFTMQVTSSLSGTTDVTLIFLDGDGYPRNKANVIYRDHTHLGGIVSPLVGSRVNLRSTLDSINQVYDTVSASISGSITDRGFMSIDEDTSFSGDMGGEFGWSPDPRSGGGFSEFSDHHFTDAPRNPEPSQRSSQPFGETRSRVRWPQ